MKSLDIGRCRITVDIDKTRSAYVAFKQPGPEECGCDYCLNWIEARKALCEGEFVKLLDSLGIPYGSEIEVWEVPGAVLPHLYVGWYIFVGGVESAEEFEIGHRKVSFRNRLSYPVEAFPEEGVAEVEFQIETGWYLEIPDPSE